MKPISSQPLRFFRSDPSSIPKWEQATWPVRFWGLCSAIVLTVEFSVAFRADARDRFADLQVYKGAVDSWASGASVYDYQRFNGDIFTYPPVAAHLLGWLHLVSLTSAGAVWMGLTVFALLTIVGSLTFGCRGLFQYWDRLPLRWSRLMTTSIIFFLLVVSSPTRSNVQFGQLSVMVVALTTYDLFASGSRFTGIFLGFAICLKLTPIIFVPFLLLAGRYRHAAMTAGTFGAVNLLDAAIWPQESARFWLGELTRQSKFVNGDIVANQSLLAFLERETVFRVNLLWAIGSCIVIALALMAGKALVARGEFATAGLLAGVASLIVSPVTWTHHQFWLVLTAFIPLTRSDMLNRWWMVSVAFLMTLGVFSAGPAPVALLLSNLHLVLALTVIVVGVLISLRPARLGP